MYYSECMRNLKIPLLTTLGVIFLILALWAANSLIYKNRPQTEGMAPEARRQSLADLSYSIDGETYSFKAGMNGFYRLEELTAYGDVDKDGDRDYVVLIKNTEKPEAPNFFLGVVEYSEKGLDPKKMLSIGNNFIPHSLLIDETGSIFFQYKDKTQNTKVLFRTFTYKDSVITEVPLVQ